VSLKKEIHNQKVHFSKLNLPGKSCISKLYGERTSKTRLSKPKDTLYRYQGQESNFSFAKKPLSTFPKEKVFVRYISN